MNAIVITINGNTPVSDKCVTEIANKIAKNVGKSIDDIEIATIDHESLVKLLAKTFVEESSHDDSYKVSETVAHAISYLQTVSGSPKGAETKFISRLMQSTGEGLFINKEKGLLLRNALDIVIKTYHKGSKDANYLYSLGYTDKTIEACSKCYDLLNVI